MTPYDLYDEPDRPLTPLEFMQAAWLREVGPDPIVDWCMLSEGQRNLYMAMLEAGLPTPALACRRGPAGKKTRRVDQEKDGDESAA